MAVTRDMPDVEEFISTGAPALAASSMTAEQRGRHNFECMLRALCVVPLYRQCG